MRSDIFRDILVTFSTQIVLLVLKFGTGLLTARLLGATGKGLFVLAFYLPGLVSTLATLGIGQSLIYKVRRQELPSEKIFLSVLVPVLIISALVLIAYHLLFPLIHSTVLRELDPDLAQLTMLLIPVLLLKNYVPNVYRARGNVRAYNGFILFANIAIFLALVVGVVFIGRTARVAIISNFTAYLLIGAVLLLALGALGQRPTLVSMYELFDLIRTGLKYHAVQFFAFMGYRFDLLLLAYFLAPKQIGIYSVGVTFAELPWMLSNSVGVVLFPEVATKGAEKAGRFTSTITRHNIAVNLSFALALALIGYPLITLTYGPEFSGAYPVLLILLPGIVLNALHRTLSSYFGGIGRPLITARVTISMMLLNVILNILLIPKFELVGAALSSAVSYSLGGIVLLILFSRETKIAWWHTALLRREDLAHYRRLASELKV